MRQKRLVKQNERQADEQTPMTRSLIFHSPKAISLTVPLAALIMGSVWFHTLRQEAISAILNIGCGLWVCAASQFFSISAPAHAALSTPMISAQASRSFLAPVIRLVIVLNASMFVISQFLTAMILVIAQLEHNHLASFTNQGFATFQIYLLGSLAISTLIPLLTLVSFSIGRNYANASFALFFGAAIIGFAAWIGGNYALGDDTGFTDPIQLQSLAGISVTAIPPVMLHLIVALGMCALLACYEWGVAYIATYFRHERTGESEG